MINVLLPIQQVLLYLDKITVSDTCNFPALWSFQNTPNTLYSAHKKILLCSILII